MCPAERHCVCLASLYRTRQGVQGRPSALLGPPQTKSVRGARWGLPSSSDNGDVPVSTFSLSGSRTYRCNDIQLAINPCHNTCSIRCQLALEPGKRGRGGGSCRKVSGVKASSTPEGDK